jgi:hypothetical protein
MMSASGSEFSIDSLLEKIAYIQSAMDADFKMVLNPAWNSTVENYRVLIRQSLAEKFTTQFTREQLALLNDLNWVPECDNTGFFSISHSRSLGGFTFSRYKHGFDTEDLRRISKEILNRTCYETEIQQCPRLEFLWVAKEAGVKALSGVTGYTRPDQPLVVTNLWASDWKSHFENKVFSFRLNSSKTLDFGHNKGFIFLEGEKLFCTYFK